MNPVPPQDDATRRRCKDGRAALGNMFLFALVVRSAALLLAVDSLQTDPDNYRLLAETFRRTGTYGWQALAAPGAEVRPTAFRPPLYPLILALLASNGHMTTTAVVALHLVLGVATVGLTYLLALRCGLAGWSRLAGAAVACDPILLNQSRLCMTETLATFVAVLVLGGLSRLARPPTFRDGLLAGGTMGLAVLCRPAFLVWAGLATLALLLRSPARKQWAGLTGLLLALSAVLAPWVSRNYLTFGHPIATTTHGGYTFLLGNNPLFYGHLGARQVGNWDAEPLSDAWQLRRYSDDPRDPVWTQLGSDPDRHVRGGAPIVRSEVEDDRFAYRLAGRYVLDQPRMFAYACLVRIARLWQLAPQRRNETESMLLFAARLAVGGWYSVVLLLAIAGMICLRGRLLELPWLWGMLLIVSVTAVHMFYWSNMRMRAPLMPFVCLLAAAGARWGWELTRRGRR